MSFFWRDFFLHIGKKKVVLVVIAFKKHEIFFLKFENFNLKSGFKIDEVDPALGCRSYDFHSFFCILIFYKKKKNWMWFLQTQAPQKTQKIFNTFIPIW